MHTIRTLPSIQHTLLQFNVCIVNVNYETNVFCLFMLTCDSIQKHRRTSEKHYPKKKEEKINTNTMS